MDNLYLWELCEIYFPCSPNKKVPLLETKTFKTFSKSQHWARGIAEVEGENHGGNAFEGLLQLLDSTLLVLALEQ